MEYCNCGSLGDLMMKGRFTLKEDEVRYVISEVLMGVAYLHSKKIIHRVCCIVDFIINRILNLVIFFFLKKELLN